MSLFNMGLNVLNLTSVEMS